MSDKNKSKEKSDPEASAVTEKEFHNLLNLDWKGIPNFPFVIKYEFDEDGYTLMVSTLAAVYGEKLDGKAVQERFQIVNPYAEMLPKVILKHVKQSVEIILEAHEEIDLKITHYSNQVSIQHQFNVRGVRFIFNFEPRLLSYNEFRAHILRPALLRALILDEEKAVLQRKVEELEGKHGSSSSSGCSGRRNFKGIYSAIKEIDPPESAVIDAFLYLQKDKTILPISLESTPNVSPTKGVHSSSTSASLHNRLKDSKNATRNIPYKEDDSDVSLGAQNTIQQSKEPEISIKVEKAEEDNADINGVSNSVDNLSTTQNLKEANKCVSPKREMAEEESKEENTSKLSPCLKPSPAKKKKLLKF